MIWIWILLTPPCAELELTKLFRSLSHHLLKLLRPLIVQPLPSVLTGSLIVKLRYKTVFVLFFRKPQQTFFLFRHQHGGNLTFRNLGLTPKSAIIALVAVVTRILTMMSTPWSGPAIPWLVWLMQLMLRKWISAAIVVKTNDFFVLYYCAGHF